jgi:hypothetical protein
MCQHWVGPAAEPQPGLCIDRCPFALVMSGEAMVAACEAVAVAVAAACRGWLINKRAGAAVLL